MSISGRTLLAAGSLLATVAIVEPNVDIQLSLNVDMGGSNVATEASPSETDGKSQVSTTLGTPEDRALLAAIRGPESAHRYNVIYGGQTFSSYADHPRVYVTIKSGPNKGKKSSAAGAYQFLARTWDAYRKKMKLKDFSPASQDRAALQLARDAYKRATGEELMTALQDGSNSAIAKVGRALNGTWTSLPSGIETTVSVQKFIKSYRAALAKERANLKKTGIPLLG